MQDFNKVNLTDLVKDAILKLDDTTQSLATSFSGTTFPTNNVEKGMTCYRTDKEILYVCTGMDGGINTWEEIGHVGIKPGTDDGGNLISSTYTTKEASKLMQENIDTVNANLQATTKTMAERFTRVNADIQTANINILGNKTNLEKHAKDANAHASVLANYLKTANLSPTIIYDALHKYGTNYVPSDVTNKGWTSLGSFISYYTKLVLKNQPSQYGQLINLCADKSNEATQIWIEQPSGEIAVRGGNGSIVMNNTPFTYLATKNDAGTIAGNVSNTNSWWVEFGGVIPLIVQGGYAKCNNTITFPKAFSKVLGVVATADTGDKEAAQARELTNTSFYLKQWNSGRYAHWIAIGV